MTFRVPSRLFVAGVVVLILVLLGITWSAAESVSVLLGVAAMFLLVLLGAAWLRSNRSGIQAYTERKDIADRLDALRKGASQILAIWSGEYGSTEVKRYFVAENADLAADPSLHIVRVINPSVIPPELQDLLTEIKSTHDQRLRLYEDDQIRSFELFVAVYPEDQDSVAMVIINDSLKRLPQVGLELDPARDPRLRSAVHSVRTWFESIAAGLPEYDPGSVGRWDRIASKYTQLVTENTKHNAFLSAYSAEERQLVGEHLASRIDEGDQVSIVEIGCGDGRALLSYVPMGKADSVAYVIGLDYSPRMIESAEEGLGHRRRFEWDRPEARRLTERTAFYEMNAFSLRRFFADGRIRDLEQLQNRSRPMGPPPTVDHALYARSRKVCCCLLNTLGVVEPDRRLEFVEAMLGALGVNDSLVLSVFAKDKFSEEAEALYHDLEEMLDATVVDEHFDLEAGTFQVPGYPGYYSHWFSEEELRELLLRAIANSSRAARLFTPPTITPMGSGGFLAITTREG